MPASFCGSIDLEVLVLPNFIILKTDSEHRVLAKSYDNCAMCGWAWGVCVVVVLVSFLFGFV